MGDKKHYDRAKIVPKVCDLLAETPSLHAAARKLKIPESTLRLWANEDADIAAQYTRARTSGFDRIALEALDISDDRDDEANSRRVRVDTRKWLLSKWSPKDYGDALKLSNDPENPFDSLSDAQLDERINARLEQMRRSDTDGD